MRLQHIRQDSMRFDEIQQDLIIMLKNGCRNNNVILFSNTPGFDNDKISNFPNE